MKLIPWTQVVEPHEDIKKGRFDESVFAADIGAVLEGRGALEYRDPDLFFKKTYFTQEISSLLESILLRLSGNKGIEPVVQLQTPFGGGKTHTLLAIYHMFKNKDIAIKSNDIKKLLFPIGLEKIPKVRIAVIDGDAINVQTIRRTAENIEIKTLWGEIAYQIGGFEAYKFIEQDDKKRVSPGSNKISALLEKYGPVIILLDETLKYLTRASVINIGETSLSAQTISFMQELTEAFSSSDRSILLASLASSSSDFSDENEERIFQRLSKVFGRVEAIKEPVKGEEIYEVIRKRLFESKDFNSIAKEVASAYWEYYQKNKEDFPREVRELSYRNAIEKSYPFHPDLINVIREKWGTISEFQKTRGVLRLLALVVSDLYIKKQASALIQLSHINLGNREIVTELLKYTGKQFEGVVASDIAGLTAKAPQIDRELGTEYAKESITEGIATSIFMHSFSTKSENGASENSLRLSSLNPELPIAIFADSLNRAKERFYYLDEKNHLYRFSDSVNLNKRIIDKEDSIKSDEVKQYIHTKLWDLIGNKFSERNRFPEEDKDIPDISKLRLVVISTENTIGKNTTIETESYINSLLNSYGNKHRQFKNILIFLVPDEVFLSQLQKSVRRYLSLIQINEEYRLKRGLSEDQRKQLQFKIRNLETDIPSLITSTYRHIVTASNNSKLNYLDMGTTLYSQNNSLSNIVWSTLIEKEKLVEKLDPYLLVSEKWNLWPTNQDMINTKFLFENFAQYPHLPILSNESVLRESIAQGITQGLFGYARGNDINFETPRFNKFTEKEDVDISGTTYLIKPEIAIKLLPENEQVHVREIKEGIITTKVIEKFPEIKKDKNMKVIKEFIFYSEIDWQNWHNFFTYVLKPLTNYSKDLIIKINIEVESNEGIPQDIIDGVKESIKQICDKYDIKKN